VTRVAVFGSTARGEANAGGDLDIIVDIDPAARVDVYGYVGITHFIEALFSVRVHVAERKPLLAWRLQAQPGRKAPPPLARGVAASSVA
jgi:predicted nucleotidyltransferase